MSSASVSSSNSIIGKLSDSKSIIGKLFSSSSLRGKLSGSSVVVNDYVLRLYEIEGGHRLVVTKGSEEQSIDIMDGTDSSGTSFTTDETLKLIDGVLSVNLSESVEKDNTLPITSAAVYTEVGNINALLETI